MFDRKEYSRNYYALHKKKVDERNRKWRKENKEKTNNYNKKYRKESPEKRRQYDYDAGRKLKLGVFIHYGEGKICCKNCGITDPDLLTIDHINDNGAEERKTKGLGKNFYQWLKNNNFPPGYQILCWNCNHKKELLRLRNRYNKTGKQS